MKTYKIEIKETLSKIIEVGASSEDEALTKIKNSYRNEDIILDENDFVDVEFINIETD